MVFCAANCLAVFPLWCCLLSGGFAFSVWRPDGSWNNHHLYALFWIRCTSKIVQVTPIRVEGLRWSSPQALISGGVSFEEGSYRIPHDKILAIEQWSESPWGLASCISPYLYNFFRRSSYPSSPGNELEFKMNQELWNFFFSHWYWQFENIPRMNHQLATTPESKYMQSPKGSLVQACTKRIFCHYDYIMYRNHRRGVS